MKEEIKDILKDASDGRLKKESKEKVQEILKQQENTLKTPQKGSKYIYNGQEYDALRDIPVPLTQAEAWLAIGKIKQK